ncbi:DUF6655 family protein [Blastopirellula retiformator]|uniref:Uncharacterized protein n=1 Tax=Blastopirellula retiformator TaxID=2527970 RepID=A0A5C5V208_9BACT|nr:DUF6655 family protein [Blastopirellula retiformator]TWT32003.1 hypothetical protein Enr8_39290 [Blastopirellula retiformator]
MAASFQLHSAVRSCALLVGLLLAAGCGTTSNRTLTEQLVSSHAVDEAIADIDFQPLRGEKVYLDPSYLKNVKGAGFVNAEYITSSIRQQMNAAGCLLQDKADDADFVVEARIGALGTEGHTVTYGIPSNNAVSSAASLLPAAPPVPTIPEIAFAKKSKTIGGAKIALFAYHRESRQPIWQSGIAQSLGTARDTWLMGAGPFQGGNIYERAQFAGSRLSLPNPFHKEEESPIQVDYELAYDFRAQLAESELDDAPQPMPMGEKEADLAGYEEERKAESRQSEPKEPQPLKKQEPTKVSVSG